MTGPRLTLTDYVVRHTPTDVSADECWIWTGEISHRGYGTFKYREAAGSPQRRVQAHRAAVEVFTGRPVPADLVVDHLCREPKCVNPAHLEAVTPGVNMHRGNAIAASVAARRARTACLRGHPYTEASTRIYRGNRICRVCERVRMRARAAALTT